MAKCYVFFYGNGRIHFKKKGKMIPIIHHWLQYRSLMSKKGETSKKKTHFRSISRKVLFFTDKYTIGDEISRSERLHNGSSKGCWSCIGTKCKNTILRLEKRRRTATGSKPPAASGAPTNGMMGEKRAAGRRRLRPL